MKNALIKLYNLFNLILFRFICQKVNFCFKSFVRIVKNFNDYSIVPDFGFQHTNHGGRPKPVYRVIENDSSDLKRLDMFIL